MTVTFIAVSHIAHMFAHVGWLIHHVHGQLWMVSPPAGVR
jgi:hypothetical protein